MNYDASIPSDILDNIIFVGNRVSAQKYNKDFSLIINCSIDIPFYSESLEQLKIRIPVDDSPEYALYLYSFLKTNKTLDLIDNYYKSNKKVLIHCMAGAQRSAAVAACYLVAKHNFKPEDAIAYIKSKRPIAFLGHVNFKETIDMFA